MPVETEWNVARMDGGRAARAREGLLYAGIRSSLGLDPARRAEPQGCSAGMLVLDGTPSAGP